MFSIFENLHGWDYHKLSDSGDLWSSHGESTDSHPITKVKRNEPKKLLHGWPLSNSNLRPVWKTEQSLRDNDKKEMKNLSNDEPIKYLDGWLLSISRYCKQPKTCMPDWTKTNK